MYTAVFNTYITFIHTRGNDKNTQMSPNRWNRHILFDEQAVNERGSKNGKSLTWHCGW